MCNVENTDHPEAKMWASIMGLVAELKRCDEAGFTTASLAMAFICIDALANLSRPADKQRVTREDFQNWVDSHLEGHAEQPYQYRGKDVYAARCAFLHTYGSKAELHAKDADTIMWGYHDGGKHSFDPEIDPRLVIIGTRSFVNDVVHAVESFLGQCKNDAALRELVESRLPSVLATIPLSTP